MNRTQAYCVRGFAISLALLLIGPGAATRAHALRLAAPADATVISAQATVTQGATICPNFAPLPVSCQYAGALSDAYDINATLKLPASSDLFDDLAANNVSITLAAGSCSDIANNGIPNGAFQATLPPLTVVKGFLGARADFDGSVVVQGYFPTSYNGGVFTHVDFHLSALGKRLAFLQMDGNANLCAPAPMALLIGFEDSSMSPDSTPDNDQLCVDFPAPVVNTLNLNASVLHACAIMAK